QYDCAPPLEEPRIQNRREIARRFPAPAPRIRRRLCHVSKIKTGSLIPVRESSLLVFLEAKATPQRFFFRPPFLPPLRELALLSFLPRPLPLFLPPPLDLLTVAQARRAASFRPTPRFS